MSGYIAKNSFQTRKIGKDFAEKIIKNKLRKKAAVLGLEGNLGEGKTTFVQGFAKGLGIKEKILSPTFVIMKNYEAGDIKDHKKKILGSRPFNLYHLDCYRVQKPKEIIDLGFKKILADPKNIIAIEWPEKIKNILPKNTLWLRFHFINKNTRKIIIKRYAR